MSGWASTSTFDAKLTASDGAAGDDFGISVATSGGTVVAGALFATIGSNGHQGTAYEFVMPSSGWASTSAFDAKLASSAGAANDVFGLPVDISGDTVVAGAPGAKIGSNAEQGAAYLFGCTATTTAVTPASTDYSDPVDLTATVSSTSTVKFA